MAYGGGILSGFVDAYGASREAERQKAAELETRETSILMELAQSADPEIASVAGAGLLELAGGGRKRKGGLRGWLGEVEASPHLAQIRALLGTSGAGSAATPPPPTPAAPGSAAQPTGSPVTGQPLTPPPAAPPMALGDTQRQLQPGSAGPAQLGGVEPAPAAATAPPARPSPAAPRRLFPSRAEQTRADRVAAAQGDLEGEIAGLRVAGFDDAEIEQFLRRKVQGRVPNLQMKRGTVNGEPATVLFDPVSGTATDLAGNPVDGFQLAMPGTARPVQGVDASGREVTAIWDPQQAAFLSADTGEPIEGFRQTRRGNEQERLVAERLYPGRALEDLGSDELTMVRAQIAADKAAEAAGVKTATEQATIAAAQTKPLTPEQSQGLRVPVGTTPGDLAGQVVPTAPQLDRLDALANLEPSVNRINELIDKVFPEGDGLMGAAITKGSLAWQRLTADPDYAALEAEIGRALNQVSRLISSERGASTEGDVLRAQASLANLMPGLLKGETRASARARVMSVIQNIQRVKAVVPPKVTVGAPSGPPAAPSGIANLPTTMPTQPGGGAPPPVAGAPAPAAVGAPAAPAQYKVGDRVIDAATGQAAYIWGVDPTDGSFYLGDTPPPAAAALPTAPAKPASRPPARGGGGL